MNKLILSLIFIIFLSGCSFIPRLTFDKANTLPQQTEKSKKNTVCNGDYKYNPDTGEILCTKGYKNSEDNFRQQERKLSLKEKIINFVSNLQGYFFWIFVAVLFLCPSLIGVVFGRMFNGARTALEATIRGIQRAKSNGGKYLEELDVEYSNNPEVRKVIDQIRTDLKVRKQI